MGFFFKQHTGQPDPKTARLAKTYARIPIHSAHALGCKVCPLARSNPAAHQDIPPSGSDRPVIYFLGEAPGAVECEQREPFVGKSGQYLRQFLPPDHRQSCRFNNVVRSRTDDHNRDPELFELECCRKSVREDIEASQPRVIVTLGKHALNWLLPGETALNKWHGRWVPVKVGQHVCWAYPLYHPAFIIRSQRRDAQGTARDNEWTQLFRQELRHVLDALIDDTVPDPVYIESGFRDGIAWSEGLKSTRECDKVLQWIDDMMQERVISVDYETNMLRPYAADARLISIAIGTFERTVAFPYEYRATSAWSAEQFARIRAAMTRLLGAERPRKIAHNFTFEAEWTLAKFGRATLFSGTWDDTMAQAAIHNEQLGMLNLDVLIRIHFGFDLKALSSLNRAKLETYPLDKLLPYNALDVKWTAALYHRQRQWLDQQPERLHWNYRQLVHTSKTLACMQARGLPVDRAAWAAFNTAFGDQLAGLDRRIEGLDEVKEFVRRFRQPFNPDSPPQVMKVLQDIMGLDDELRTQEGKASTSDDVLSRLQLDFAALILERRAIAKKKSTYIDPIPQYIEHDGKIHTSYTLLVTRTGRLCVAKGTRVETVRDYNKHPDGVPIETVKAGDWVYTYGDDLRMTLRRVNWSGKTGRKQVIRIHWQGTGHNTTGYLDVTPNHPVRLTTGEYRRADELAVGDGVLALTRTIQHGRSYFYQTGRRGIVNDQRFVYEQRCGPIPPGFHTHHVDHNPLNNVPENLVVMKHSEHCRHHAVAAGKDPRIRRIRLAALTTAREHRTYKTGEENPTFLHLTRHQCLRLLAESKGKPTQVGHDFQTFINKLNSHDIRWLDVKRRYGRDGVYLSKGLLLRTLKHHAYNRTAAQRAVGTNFYNFNRLVDYYGIAGLKTVAGHQLTRFGALRALATTQGQPSKVPYDYKFFTRKLTEWGIDWRAVKQRYAQRPNNHTVTGVEWLDDAVDVYDLEVEDTHNFIAGGLCIHNSSESPNMQNWPNRKGRELRRMIVPPPGHAVVAADYGQIEARLIAVSSQDPVFMEMIWDDYDVHMDWAEKIAAGYPNSVGGRAYIRDAAKLKQFRKRVKNEWVFPAFYGASAKSIAYGMKIPEDIVDRLFRQFWREFDGIRKWQRWLQEFYRQHGYVETLTGRRRHGPLAYNKIINTPIQGLASDICVDAMNRLEKKGIGVVMNVHDDITSFVPLATLEPDVVTIAETMASVRFPFINVPIAVEIAVGRDWEAMEEVGTFTSPEYIDVSRARFRLDDYQRMRW